MFAEPARPLTFTAEMPVAPVILPLAFIVSVELPVDWMPKVPPATLPLLVTVLAPSAAIERMPTAPPLTAPVVVTLIVPVRALSA